MNSEHPNPYTAEEMASNLFQTAPVELHMVVASRNSRVRPGAEGTAYYSEDYADVQPVDVVAGDGEMPGTTVGYIRRDIYEAQAARVAELEQLLAGCTVDLAKLDASRGGAA